MVYLVSTVLVPFFMFDFIHTFYPIVLMTTVQFSYYFYKLYHQNEGHDYNLQVLHEREEKKEQLKQKLNSWSD